MLKTVTAQEAAKALGIDRHLMPVLFETGLLLGIKTGRGRRYSEKELEEFWEEYKGEDLSNAEQIRLVSVLHRKKRLTTGKESVADNRIALQKASSL